MNGQKAKRIRRIAKAIAEENQETKYLEINKHQKIVSQRLSLSEMKKRSAEKSEDGKFDFSGFLEGGNMINDILRTTIVVSQRVLDPACFRAKFKGLKKNWEEISSKIPVVAKL